MRLSRLRFAASTAGIAFLLVAFFCSVLPTNTLAQSSSEQQLNAASTTLQDSFANPQRAADTLIRAAAEYDVPALLKIFGPEGKDFVSSADPVQDKNLIDAFVAKAREKKTVTIDPKNGSRATLIVGNDDWPFPVPIVRRGRTWIFDSRQGHDEILFRRIGENELDAIQVCKGFVEAQKEYASEIRDGSGVNQYAQKVI